MTEKPTDKEIVEDVEELLELELEEELLEELEDQEVASENPDPLFISAHELRARKRRRAQR